MEKVELEFKEQALAEVAKKAIKRKTGARGLRSILEKILLETMYELPDEEGVERVVIDGDVVNGNNNPIYIHSDGKKSKSNSEDKKSLKNSKTKTA